MGGADVLDQRRAGRRVASEAMNSTPAICACAASTEAWLDPVATTVAPSAWNSLAVAAPIPLVPPVMRAILPSSVFMLVSTAVQPIGSAEPISSIRYGSVLHKDGPVAGNAAKPDRRTERSKAVVLAETYRQLSQGGLANVSIDEISRVSGVSKTTIYRHWPSRSALLIDACSRLGGDVGVPDTGSLRGDLHALLSSLAEQLRTASWSAVIPSIADAAERDPEISAMQAQWQKSVTAPFVTLTERAKGRAEVSTDVNASDLVATTVGALFYRRWFSREPLDTRFVDMVVDQAVAATCRT